MFSVLGRYNFAESQAMVVNADFFSGSKTREQNSSKNQLHF